MGVDDTTHREIAPRDVPFLPLSPIVRPGNRGVKGKAAEALAKEEDMRKAGNVGDHGRYWYAYRRALSILLAAAVLFLLLAPPASAAGYRQGKEGGQAGTQVEAGAVCGDGEHYLGLQPSPAGDYPQVQVPLKYTVSLEASKDLSVQLPPVGDQGQQGSCVAWAASYYYKSWSEKQEHASWNLANPYYQFSPSFVYNQINGGTDGGATFTSAFSLMQSKGDVDIAEMPYNQNDYKTKPNASQLEAAKPYRIPGDWASFWVRSVRGPYSTPNNIDSVKAWLSGGKVLVMAIPVYRDFPDYGGNPPKAYYDYNGYSSLAGGHGVCICGYDDNVNPGGADADHRGGFKMVNSWGAGWNGASAGYVWLSYDFVKRYVWEAWAMNDLGPDSPAITSLSASEAAVGDTIHIYGDNFGTLRRAARVSFNGVVATSASFTNTDITVTVPAGATSGPLSVYDWDGAASNWVSFTVSGTATGPRVISINPSSGMQNSVVSITDLAGSGFQAGASVRLEGNGAIIGAAAVSVVSATRITCTIDLTGAAAGTYDVVVRNPDGGEGRLAGGFTVNAACGQGASATLLVFAAAMGLLSFAGAGGLRRRRRRS